MKPLYTPSDRSREVAVEGESAYRSAFRRDYARLLHCPAFRRLQGKTQLFPSVEHDFFRNRLTHSLEVAQIAKSIALRLNHCNSYFVDNPIDLDLVEAAVRSRLGPSALRAQWRADSVIVASYLTGGDDSGCAEDLGSERPKRVLKTSASNGLAETIRLFDRTSSN